MRRRDTGAGPESHPFNHSKDSDVDEPPPRLRLGGIKLRLLVEARHNRSKTRLWACNSSEIVLLENRYNSCSRKIWFFQKDALFLRITCFKMTRCSRASLPPHHSKQSLQTSSRWFHHSRRKEQPAPGLSCRLLCSRTTSRQLGQRRSVHSPD